MSGVYYTKPIKDAGSSKNEIILIKFPLLDTKVCIKINKKRSETLEISLGSGQGDSLSGKLFTLHLAGTLYHLTAMVTKRPNPPIEEH